MSNFETLQSIKKQYSGKRFTEGLSDAVIKLFLARDPQLGQAIDAAAKLLPKVKAEFADAFSTDEEVLIEKLGDGFLNFYDRYACNPYIPLAGKGPWIVSMTGAVIHDSGGYGMLGFGHNPDAVDEAMGREQVMANIMTSSFALARFMKRIRKEIGHARPADKKETYAKFVCMNSGSEAMTVALRVSDMNAKTMTDPGGRHAGKRIMLLSHKGSFHGRTERPAIVSDSSQKKYQLLASFRDNKRLITTPPNDLDQLAKTFEQAQKDGVFIEAMLIEPVMGEGNPGVGVTPEYYRLARELTRANGTILIVDSIQAGLRTTGCLSIVDYPGFTDLEAPDMESYSKALNAGQYPLSVLALSKKTADIYQVGVYGNTMTTNPRALDVASAVLDSLTPEIRANIVSAGKKFVQGLKKIQSELNGAITDVQGTGLLFCAHLDGKRFKAVGKGSTEEILRRQGIGVIHGGENALRFTPHFRITDAEIDLVIEHVKAVLK
jgi:acetylornithine/succinyldiaminopimelate/putrescine aminotransferase